MTNILLIRHRIAYGVLAAFFGAIFGNLLSFILALFLNTSVAQYFLWGCIAVFALFGFIKGPQIMTFIKSLGFFGSPNRHHDS